MIITISRQTSTNGELIGRLVAERLGLSFLDRELVDELARRLQVESRTVEKFDESVINPVQSVLLEWKSSINEQAYYHALSKAFHRISLQGNTVIIGRGANFLLHCPECLHVRIIAPLALRVAIYRTANEVTAREAEQRIQEGDREKAQYIRNLFHKNIDDPENYDIVLNLAAIPPEMAAEIIMHAAKERPVRSMPLEEKATLPQHLEIMARHRRPVQPPVIETKNR